GAIFNLTSNGDADIYIQKLDANGNFLWAKSLGGIDVDRVSYITTDISGNVYLTGFFSGTVDFDPGVGVVNLTATGVIDIFILKITASGTLSWAKSCNGTGNAGGSGISV